MKIVKKELPHEKTVCIQLIVKYVESMVKEKTEHARLYWGTNIIIELQHLI